MADSYHIIDGQVVPYSGGRKCHNTDAWRDATPLELQLQEQLAEYECATAAKDTEIEALRAEVDRMKDMAMMQAARAAAAERESERLAEALRFARTRFAPYMDDTDRAAFDAALHPAAAQENDDA